MERLVSAIEKLGDSDERRVFKLAGMLADPLTRRIMAKLASPQGPISVDGIPKELNGDRGATISRLSRLEQAGLLRSEKVSAGSRFCKKYIINDNGRDPVSKYMKEESKLFE